MLVVVTLHVHFALEEMHFTEVNECMVLKLPYFIDQTLRLLLISFSVRLSAASFRERCLVYVSSQAWLTICSSHKMNVFVSLLELETKLYIARIQSRATFGVPQRFMDIEGHQRGCRWVGGKLKRFIRWLAGYCLLYSITSHDYYSRAASISFSACLGAATIRERLATIRKRHLIVIDV